MDEQTRLSRRERQIMDIVYTLSKASVTEVLGHLPDPPTRMSVRTTMRILEEKGHLKHTKRSREFIYHPTRRRRRVGQSALRRVLETFFDGSLEQAVAVHLSDPRTDVSDEERRRLADLILKARKKGG